MTEEKYDLPFILRARGFSGARINALLALDLTADEQVALASLEIGSSIEKIMFIIGAIEDARKASVEDDDGE